MDKDIVAVSRSDLDITDVDQIAEVVAQVCPSIIINCAAYTAVDMAETDEELATEINGRAVGRLAEVAADSGCRFVTYSTDYVFDGTATRPYVESDLTNPVGAYGRSKLVGEQLALAASSDSLVIRTSWVLSGTHDNFVATMIRLVAQGKQLSVVNDQMGNPTVVDDLAEATIALLEADIGGVMHVTNSGSTTWFDLARFAVSTAGLDANLIQPCTTEEYPTPARRPTYSVLGSERIGDTVVGSLRPWTDATRDVVEAQSERLGLRR
jgi:dTDP-4-dehydrorhamnose reductase